MKATVSCVLIAVLCACSKDQKHEAYAQNSSRTKTPTTTEQTTGQTDADLTRRVRQALSDNTALSTSGKNIVVVANNGDVTLTGEVATAEEKSRIESAVAAVSGVRHVDNQITVRP